MENFKKLVRIFDQKRIQIIILLLIIFLAYINIFSNQFSFDDPTFIINWQEAHSLSNVPLFFNGVVPPGHQGIYRPIRSMFYAISYHLWGTTPFGYHIQSLLINLTAAILIYLITAQITKKNILAFMTALLFGLHPVHVDAITFMTASFDTIGTVFFLLSFYLYLQSQTSQHKKKMIYIVSIITASIAFFSYEMTVMLPLLIVLHDLCFHKNNLNNLKKLTVYCPYFAILLMYGFIRVVILHIITRGDYIAGNLYITFLTMIRVLFKYISLLVLPINLTVQHTVAPGIRSYLWLETNKKALLEQSIKNPQIFLPLLLVLILIIAAFLSYKKYPIVSFCIVWFFISWFPASNVIPQAVLMNERYIFIPSFGYCFLVAYLVYSIYQLRTKIKLLSRLRILLVILFLFTISAYMYLTVMRNKDWHDGETLWTSAVKLAPDSTLNLVNLALAYDNSGKKDLAIDQFRKLVELSPNDFKTHYYLGVAYEKNGNFDLAKEAFLKASSIKKDAYIVYIALGEIYQKQNNLYLAIETFQKAIEVDKTYPESYFNLATAYEKLGKIDKALENYKKAIGVSLDHYDKPHNNLGIIYYQERNYDLAVEEFKKALAINPDFAEAHFNLGKVYDSLGQFNLAINEYEKAIEINPNNIQAHNNLGIIYGKANRLDLAVEEFKKALAINPDFAEAHFNLGKVYSQQGKTK